jgi:hypothetical protein
MTDEEISDNIFRRPVIGFLVVRHASADDSISVMPLIVEHETGWLDEESNFDLNEIEGVTADDEILGVLPARGVRAVYGSFRAGLVELFAADLLLTLEFDDCPIDFDFNRMYRRKIENHKLELRREREKHKARKTKKTKKKGGEPGSERGGEPGSERGGERGSDGGMSGGVTGG